MQFEGVYLVLEVNLKLSIICLSVLNLMCFVYIFIIFVWYFPIYHLSLTSRLEIFVCKMMYILFSRDLFGNIHLLYTFYLFITYYFLSICILYAYYIMHFWRIYWQYFLQISNSVDVFYRYNSSLHPDILKLLYNCLICLYFANGSFRCILVKIQGGYFDLDTIAGYKQIAPSLAIWLSRITD